MIGGGGTSPLIGGNSYGTGLFSSLGRSSVDMPTKRDTMNGKDGKAEMEGWLHKQGDRYKTWNKRWFVLRGANLFYFKSPKVKISFLLHYFSIYDHMVIDCKSFNN